MSSEQSNKDGSKARLPSKHMAVGRILRPHGIRGELVLEVYTDLVFSIEKGRSVFLGLDRSLHIVRSIRSHRDRVLLGIANCVDRDTAEGYRDQEVFIVAEEAEPLEEGVYFHWQILGLDVLTEDGRSLGKIVKIHETGANDVYIVRDESGNELLLPAIEAVVRRVDLESGRILVHLLPGLENSTKS